jgi:tetratricopeptide (TPR) repeat protein
MTSFGPPSTSEFYNEARILYLIEEGQYSAALSLFGDSYTNLSPRMLLTKALCYYLENRVPDSLELVLYAEQQGWPIHDLYELKGRCLYSFGEYHTAKLAFEKSDALAPSIATRRWIQRCIARIAAGAEEISRRVVRLEAQMPHLTPKTTITAKHEWYQSKTHLVLTWFVRGVVESQLQIQCTPTSVRIRSELPQPAELLVNLSKEIDPDDFVVTITPMKLEVKLGKGRNSIGQWQDYEV